jgi:predicted transcriptional regulator
MENEGKGDAKTNGNAKTNLLSQLLGSGDQSIKLITLAMVVVSGGGNFFATKEVGRISDQEAQRAVQQLDDLHARLDTTMSRQKEMYEIIKTLGPATQELRDFQGELSAAIKRQREMDDRQREMDEALKKLSEQKQHSG